MSDNRCIICCRVSSKEQAEKGNSLEAQLDYLRDYAKRKKLKIVKEFSWSESASKQGRIKFEKALNFAKVNEIPHILFEKVDRLTRETGYKFLILISELMDKHNKYFHCVKDGEIVMHKDASSNVQFQFDIYVAVAKQFARRLSEETKKGLDVKVKHGFFPRPAPVGYLDNGRSEKVIDQEKAPLIKFAFEAYASGKYSLTSLRDELRLKELRNKKNNPITRHGLETILKNSFYYGYFEWKDKFVKGEHEPIITKELFDKVQSVFASRNKVGYSHPSNQKTKLIFPFKGLLKCGYCGCSVSAEIKKEKFVYYRCSFAKGKCNLKYFRQEKIDSIFLNHLSKFHILEWSKLALKNSHSDESQKSKNEIKRLQLLYTKNENKIHQLYDDKLEGIITKEFFKVQFEKFQHRQLKIEEEIRSLRSKNIECINQGIELFELIQNAKEIYVNSDIKKRAEILKVIVDYCEIKNNSIKFHFNQPFDFLYRIAQGEALSNGKVWQRYRDSNPGLMAENHLS